MVIFNEKGKPYMLQGPPGKVSIYWDLNKVKYINFENYGSDSIHINKPIELPKLKVKEEPIQEIKVELKNTVKDKIVIENKPIKKESAPIETEEQIINKIQNLSGAPMVYQECITKEEYKFFARALDLKENIIYCDKKEFDIYFPKKDDIISYIFLNSKWKIIEVNRIGSIIKIKYE